MVDDSPAPCVAIVGGGFLGSALAQVLAGPVVVTTRSGTWAGGTPRPGVVLAPLDITASTIDPTVLQPARALVVAVAPGRTQDRHELYVEGTRRLLAAIDDTPWERVVFVSSTSAYAETDGWVDETQTAPPPTERGRVQVDAEAVVERWARARGTAWTCLRLGGLYGPGRELGRLYRARGDAPLPGDGNTATNLVHRDDAVEAIRRALAADADVTGVIGVVDDDHCSRRSMYDAMAAAAGLEPPRWERPPALGAVPHGKRVSNLRMKLELGVRLRHPTHGVRTHPIG